MNNKKYIISAIGLLSFVGIAHAAIFQCRTCAEGTYGDGTSVSCTKCPTGAVCPEGTGAPIYLSNYKDKLLSVCGEIGKEIAIDTAFSSSNFVSEMIDKQKVKINYSGDIIKKGESGYNSARAYYEVSCYDLDGYYTSSGYKAITDFIQNKICNDESEVKSHLEPMSSSSTLTPGIYRIEVAGAGGGGGGGHCCPEFLNMIHKDGGNGGSGATKTEYIYLLKSETFSYTVGKGGSGGKSRKCKCSDSGSSGGNSYLSNTLLSLSVSASGGAGGGRACEGGSTDAKNLGLGGKGGSGGEANNRCKYEDGDSGSNGWVKIYQIGMRKTGCPSLRPSTSSGGCSSGGYFGGCSTGGYFGGCSGGY